MRWRHISALLAIAGGLLAPACASIGRPDGGERDKQPPRYVSSRPAMGATGVSATRFTVNFDENIQLDDAFNKVIVSPVQSTPPSVSSNGRRLTVELRDTLVPDATYTIDFGDAIKDLNEGNILDGFALDFSTGSTIDSLRISGIVLAAENLEPAQGMLVGVYRADSTFTDTTLTTTPLLRVARTNQLGQFTVRGLAPGPYRIYAINDINRDYRWDRSEDVAFLDVDLIPSVEQIEVTDTLRAHDGSDSLATRPGVRFVPNDVLLTWFNQDYRAQYLKDYKRPTRRTLSLNFGAPLDSLPRIEVVNDSLSPRPVTPARPWTVMQINPGRDSLQYWITDSAVYATDSLRLAVSYMRPDSTEQLRWTTDTLRFFFRDPPVKPEKKKKKSKDEEAAEHPDSVVPDTLPPPPVAFINLRARSGTNQDVHLPLRLEADDPLAAIDTAAIHLEVLRDTVYESVPSPLLSADSLSLLRRNLSYDWEPGAKYRLSIDSAAVIDIYGLHNKPFRHEFTVRPLEEYSAITFNITGLPDSTAALVQLLGSNDQPAYAVPVTQGNRAVFRHINPSTYYARLIIDRNANARWDTGLADSIQPEDVYYFAKALKLRKNWDITQDWDINELPVDMQKPLAIKKNKPKLKPGEKARRDDDDEEEDDEFGSNAFINNRNGAMGNFNRGGTNGLQGAGNNGLRR